MRTNVQKDLFSLKKITGAVKPVKSRRRHFPPCFFPPKPKTIYSDDSEVRRMEYLTNLCEISGSTEGCELESLSNITQEQFKNYSYEEEMGTFEDTLT